MVALNHGELNVSYMPLVHPHLPGGQIERVAPFVNQMSCKAWWLRHDFRRLKIRKRGDASTGCGYLDTGFGFCVWGYKQKSSRAALDAGANTHEENSMIDARVVL